jgi:hypothetical protein
VKFAIWFISLVMFVLAFVTHAFVGIE